MALGAFGGAVLLEACRPATTPAPTSSGTPAATGAGERAAAAGAMPTFVPFPNKPTPEYPSSGEPYLDGYDNFPKNPVRALSGDVGLGSTVTAMTIGLFPPPTPYENNPAWQAFNKELNVDFKMNIVPSGDYVAKLATVM